MSSFLVRRVSQHTLPTNNQVQRAQHKLAIRPQKIIFNAKDEIVRQNIVKLILTSSYNYRIQFQIKQPKQQLFSVRCSKTEIGPGESIQLYLFNNFSHYVCNVSDQLIISTHLANLFVPIQVINCEIARKTGRTLRKQPKAKQNMHNLTKSQLGNQMVNTQMKNVKDLRVRKDGLMIINRDHRERVDLMFTHDKQQENSLLNRIFKFNQEYERIHLFLKDKVIKNQIYLGERQISRQKINEIISFNLSTELITRELMQQKIITRYQSKNTKDGPSVRAFENVRLQWNKAKNEPIITYKKGLQKVFRQVRNIVIYYRFRKMNKILSIYRSMRGEQNIEQPQTKIINKLQYSLQNEEEEEQSFIWAENKQNSSEDREYQMEIQEKKKHDYYCRKISKMISNKKERNLGADFNQFTLAPRLLPADYTEPQAKKTHYFQIKPRIGFDNWVSLQESTVYNHELMGYTKMQRLPQWECYPCFQDKFKASKVSKNGYQKQQRQQKHFKEHEKEQANFGFSQQNTFKIDKKQLLNSKQATKSLRQQFGMALAEQNFTKYKNYSQSEYEIDCLSLQKINDMQLDIKKPKRASLSTISQVKHNRQQYLPFFQKPFPSLIQTTNSTMNLHQQQLKYSFQRQDIIDFDDPSDLTLRKLDYIEKMEENNKNIYKKMKTIISCYQSNNSISQCIISQKDVCFKKSQKHSKKDKNNSFEKGQGREWQLVDCNSKAEENDQIVYEKILQNLKLSQIRKYGIANGRISSYNGFAKKKQNKIYY